MDKSSRVSSSWVFSFLEPALDSVEESSLVGLVGLVVGLVVSLVVGLVVGLVAVD